MFERYTEKARRVIFFARYEASQVGAPAIEPEHLLLGLMREDVDLLRRFCPNGAESGRSIREAIQAQASPREKLSPSVELPLASESKRILAFAHEESDTLQHRHVGTEHFLLGLLHQKETLAAQVLLEHGLELETLRGEIVAKGLASPRAGEWKTLLGLERLLERRLDLVRGARVGLVCNQASVDHNFRHAADLLHEHAEVNLTALFGPQHGIRGDVQDNMIETEHSVDQVTGLRIHSLYSETREPTQEMLEDVDLIVFDMQDVGCRIYTFAYTLANCMRAAKAFNKKVLVCDRPNPINGKDVAGNVLEPSQASFVGQFPIPTRHGMTLGELALMFNDHFGIGCDLEVVMMRGWKRESWQDETDAPWVMPSPNMPTIEAATVFPGTVHFEGTQISEGRGTTRPFELVGAPYIVPHEYAAQLNNLNLPGVFFRSCVFRPTFQKHAGVSCGGVQIHVLNRKRFEPVTAGVAMVKVVHDMYKESFRWKESPYEYVYDRNPFDVIAGTTRLREAIEEGSSLESIVEGWQTSLADFLKIRERYLLY
ncbi:MAG TPA: exo-beta-N-acetylmuramidase NamZ domain-containing protein [Pyrinomonadaceae bacterium]|nr:exo-beta-N-acetylmuramidase NamZ domain-containing protein [Pyrinomonadaceae bacterium]